MIKSKISLFDHGDFRAYLAAVIEEQKAENSKFSYQYFSNLLGQKSRSSIHKIVKGTQRNIPTNLVMRLSEVLGHSRKEAEYFETLVAFDLAESAEEKNRFLERLQALLGKDRQKVLLRDQYDYFSNWYYPVLRELLCMPHVRRDFPAIGKLLDPPISATQVRRAVDTLLELDLIRDENGHFVQTDTKVHSGEDFRSLAIWNFQQKNLELAQRSLKEHAPEDRDISTLTFGIHSRGFSELKKKLLEVRRELAELAEKYDNGMDRVYQLNLQLFPLTRETRK